MTHDRTDSALEVQRDLAHALETAGARETADAGAYCSHRCFVGDGPACCASCGACYPSPGGHDRGWRVRQGARGDIVNARAIVAAQKERDALKARLIALGYQPESLRDMHDHELRALELIARYRQELGELEELERDARAHPSGGPVSQSGRLEAIARLRRASERAIERLTSSEEA